MHNIVHPVALQSPAGILRTGNALDAFTDALYSAIVLVVLSTAAVGLFTGLTIFAAIVLVQRGLRRPGVLFLFLATLLMYASAVVYWVGLLLNTIGVYNVVQAYGSQLHCQALVCEADAGLIAPPPGDCPSGHYGLAGAIRALTLCAPTIILAVNVILGDAIVWWRVWVLWPRSLLVRTSCLVLIWMTLSAGLFDVNDSCPASAFAELRQSNLDSDPPGTLFEQDLWGLGASVLSLATNFVATALIGIKAWEHRHILATAQLKRSTQVERVLSLLIESGALYCLLWMAVVAYQVVSQVQFKSDHPKLNALMAGFDYFLKGCLIPLVGIYPTAIVILVGLDKSQFSGTDLGHSSLSKVSTVVFRQPRSSTASASSTRVSGSVQYGPVAASEPREADVADEERALSSPVVQSPAEEQEGIMRQIER